MSPSKEAIPLIRSLFHCKKGWPCKTWTTIMKHVFVSEGHHGFDWIAVGFTSTYEISAYLHFSCEIDFHPWSGVINKTLCDKVCKWIAEGLLFASGTLLSPHQSKNLDFIWTRSFYFEFWSLRFAKQDLCVVLCYLR